MPTFDITFIPVTIPPAKAGEYLAQVQAGQDVDFSTVIAVQYRDGAWWCPTVLVENPAGGWMFRAYDVSDLVQGWAEFPFGLTPLANLSDIGYAETVEVIHPKGN